MRNWKSIAGLLGLSVATLAVVDACSSGAEQRVGQMLVDAGNALAGASGSSMMSTGGASGADGPGADAGILLDAGRLLVDAGAALMDAGQARPPDASAQASPNKSGSRIHLRRTTQMGTDGTLYEFPLATYYDTQLNVACSLTAMSDGTKRCAPAGDGIFISYFSDAACTTRLALVAGNCITPKFISETIPSTGPACTPTHMRFYRAGAVYSGTVYGSSSASCAATTPIAGYRVFSLGAELLPTELVELTETTQTL